MRKCLKYKGFNQSEPRINPQKIINNAKIRRKKQENTSILIIPIIIWLIPLPCCVFCPEIPENSPAAMRQIAFIFKAKSKKNAFRRRISESPHLRQKFLSSPLYQNKPKSAITTANFLIFWLLWGFFGVFGLWG